mmetsp:Transcript_94859/g.217172  ORF Transcript_94859/g.217172 Transcript_94859/m.217172 type:complete len:288 (-) Transcript_94859:226-1089(-)
MPLSRIDEEPTIREPPAKRGVCWTACTGPLGAALRPRPPATKPSRSRPAPHGRGGRPRPQRPRPRSRTCSDSGGARGKGKSQRELDELFAQLQSQLAAAWTGRGMARALERQDTANCGGTTDVGAEPRLPRGEPGRFECSAPGIDSPVADPPTAPPSRCSADSTAVRSPSSDDPPPGALGHLAKVVDDVMWLSHVVDDRAQTGCGGAEDLTARARFLVCRIYDKQTAGENVSEQEAAELVECKEELVEVAAMLKKMDLRPDSAGSGRSYKRSYEVSTACQSVEEVVY